jgi:hypothetical protein
MTRLGVALLLVIGVVLLTTVVDSWLEWVDRQRYADDCPDCAAEPPSRLDAQDKP